MLYVLKYRLNEGKYLSNIGLVIAAIVFLSLSLPLSAIGEEYWAKYDLHIYSIDNTDHLVANIYVNLTDPEFPETNITGFRIISGFEDTDQSAIEYWLNTAVDTIFAYFINITMDPAQIPQSGDISYTVFNFTVNAEYNTNTGLLERAEIRPVNEGNYYYVLVLTDTNYGQNAGGVTTTTMTVTATSSTPSPTTTSTSINLSGKWVTYDIDVKVEDPTQKIDLTARVRYYLETSNGEVLDLKVRELENMTEDEVKEELSSIPFPLTYNETLLSINGTSAKAKLYYDEDSHVLYAFEIYSENNPVGYLKAHLVDTNINELKEKIGVKPWEEQTPTQTSPTTQSSTTRTSTPQPTTKPSQTTRPAGGSQNTQSTQPTRTIVPPGSSNWMIYTVIGIVIAIIAGVAVALVKRKKKQTPQHYPYPPPPQPPPPPPPGQ